MKNFAIIPMYLLACITACATNNGANLSNRTRLDAGKYKCTYTYSAKTVDTNAKEVTVVSSTQLLIGEHGAKFADITVFEPDSLASVGSPSDSIAHATDMMFSQTYPFTSTVYQNYPEGKLTTVDICKSNYAVLTEDFAALDWELAEDTLTVCDHLCYKAITHYGGRTWEAWYAEDIPMSYGPWKLSGLPGLIMAANDTDGVNSFVINSLQSTDLMVSRPKSVKEISVNRKDFLRMKKEYENAHYGFSGELGEMLKNATESGKPFTVFVGGMQIIFRCANYVPLELE